MGLITDQDVYILAEEYRFCPFKRSKYEARQIEGDLYHFTLANIWSATNILIKVHCDELEHEE